MFLFHFHGTVFKAVSLFSQLWQKQLKGERICFGSQFVGGGEGTVLGCERLTLHPESGGRDGCWCSACFLLHLPGLQSMEWHHPQWVDLLTLVNSRRSSQPCPEVCLLGSSRPCQGNNIDLHTDQATAYWPCAFFIQIQNPTPRWSWNRVPQDSMSF